MARGHEKAINELEHLHTAMPDGFEFEVIPDRENDWLKIKISLCLGLMETKPGGLPLREREDFLLMIPPDYPFEYPHLMVMHKRFAGFPHVTWSTFICLYQSDIEWNPTDGLYGFFDRLTLWLGRAAINDMDPIEGPLHPPAYIPDNSLPLFVIRADSPIDAGQSWCGLAELEKHTNRMELVGWNDLSGGWPDGRLPALAIFLPESLPVEFPVNGKDFFNELMKQGYDKQSILRDLRITAQLTDENEPAFLILATPMRRSIDGRMKHHITIWGIDPDNARHLRNATPREKDWEQLITIKEELNELTYKVLELTPIKWCRVLEDRNEIVLRRDLESPISWFADKKVLILGCGALGSWIAEIISRAKPSLIHLVDNALVKPGILVRQNFRLKDIGMSKSYALSRRLKTIVSNVSIQYFNEEAHGFITKDPKCINNYDIVLDCTASHIFQMKLERDWDIFNHQSPPLVSIVIDAKAKHCLCVAISPNASGGLWDAYMQLKQKLCLDGIYDNIISSFYSESATKDLFQPEPGCSDPTFTGSTADVVGLASTALNLVISYINKNDIPIGIAFSSHNLEMLGLLEIKKLSVLEEFSVGQCKVRIAEKTLSEARGWVRQNNRIRSRNHETGGILWGVWDEALGIIWVFDASGPPSDSIHDPGHFNCGVEGTLEEHTIRIKRSYGTTGFIGFWHTHPDTPSRQSITDRGSMANLVSRFGSNQRKALMMIYGRSNQQNTVGLYLYQSQTIDEIDLVSIGVSQFELQEPVV